VLIALPALGTDLFVPSLPMLARGLQVEVAAAQLTLTAYFFGLAAGQLLWGPLSDRFGRKPVLLSALALMLASTLAAAFMTSVAAVGTRAPDPGPRDVERRGDRALDRARPVCARAGGAAAGDQSPSCSASCRSRRRSPAPAGRRRQLAGGVLVPRAAAALLLAWTGLGLAETAPAERRSMHPVALARTFAAILGERRFVAPFLLILCSHIGILSWVSNSAFTLVSGLGITVGAYSLMFAAVMCGQIGGAWSSRRLVPRLGIARLLRSGAATMFAGGAAAAVFAWAGVAHWLAVVAPFFVFLFGTALIVPNATAAALSPFPGAAGSASSLIGAIGFTAGAIVSSLLGAAFDGSARPMASVAAVRGYRGLHLGMASAAWKSLTPS
jgi:DHA1 family bicyclomycin/chloramphenicol resistance-like MFS transporter